MQKKLLLTLIVAALSGHAVAGERESMEALRATTLNLINALVEQGVLPKAKADALIKEAEAKAAVTTVANAPTADGAPPVVRVQYIPEAVKSEIREQLKREVLAQARTERWGEPGSLPDWISRIKFDGDVRLRYQQDIFQSYNASIGNFTTAYANYQKVNETKPSYSAVATASPDQYYLYVNQNGDVASNRDTYKLRARLGMTASINDDVSTRFRISTGSTTTPISTNQTLGNGLNKYSLVLDRAYLRYTPTSWLTLTAGRLDNPWLSTELIWAPDLGFEGMTAEFRRKTGDSSLTPWLTMGAFPLQELGSSARNKWLYAAQAGMDLELSPTTTARIGLAIYDYHHIHGELDDPSGANNNNDYTAPTFVQKGNTLFNLRPSSSIATTYTNGYLFGLASDYRLVNLTGSLDLADFDPVHVWLTGDIVKNIGYKASEIARRVGTSTTGSNPTYLNNPLEAKTLGYLAKVSVGMRNLTYEGDWQFNFSYRYLERDAVLDAYTDSDFHLGGTDAKGYVLSAGYAFAKNSWLDIKWMSAKEISGLPLSIDVLQTDVNVRF